MPWLAIIRQPRRQLAHDRVLERPDPIGDAQYGAAREAGPEGAIVGE
ncbi:MAG: hypothetical protein R3E68_18335 [Burkholderiaceae bacterium]